MNSINIIGNLTDAPTLRSTSKDTPVANFRIGHSGRRDDDRLYLDVVAWDKLGSVCAERLNKGDRVGITGRLQMRTYTGSDGIERTAYEIRANNVDFLTPKENGSATDEDDAAA